MGCSPSGRTGPPRAMAFFRKFLPPLTWGPPRPECGYLLHSGLLSGVCRAIPALMPAAPPLFYFSDLGARRAVSLTFFLAPLRLCGISPFLKHVFPWVPPSWLRCWAGPCGRAAIGPALTGVGQPQPLLTSGGRPPPAPCPGHTLHGLHRGRE